MRASKLPALAALLLLVAAPTARFDAALAAPSRPAVHRVSGLAVVPLTIRHGRKTFGFRVELARAPREQAQGLMFRTAMGANEGMIFPMEPPRLASFWMRNTVLPLDLVFIGVDGRIISIAADATPYSEEQILSGGVVKAVLELNAGRTRQLGIAIGDRVRW